MNWPSLYPRCWRGVISGMVSAFIAILVSQHAVMMGLEEWMLDGCFCRRGVRPSTAKIVIIGLDQLSLDEMRKPTAFISPEIATVVRYAHEMGASAIGIDLIIPESMSGMEAFLDPVNSPAKLGEAIVQTNKVVLAELTTKDSVRLPLLQWRLKNLSNPEPTDFGFVNLNPEFDYFVRKQAVLSQEGDHLSFAAALLSRAKNLPVHRSESQVMIGDQPILLENASLRINYVGPPGHFPMVSFRDILRQQVNGRQPTDVSLNDAIVIIGLIDVQIDGHVTPFSNGIWADWRHHSNLMAGPEVHANIIATLNDGAYISTKHRFSSWPVMLFCGGMLGAIYEQLNRLRGSFRYVASGIALTIALLWSLSLIAHESFRLWQWRIEVVPMMLLILVVLAGSFVVRWHKLRGILGVLKTSAIVDELEVHTHGPGVSGDERVVTILFADLIKFTAYSERSASRDVIRLLNTYFSAVYPFIDRHDGTLNQFAGDGMMVIFGAPKKNDGHAENAIDAAIAMVQQVHRMRSSWTDLGFPELEISIGIHTGSAIVGTVGSPKRFDYTAIGDVTNTASRIESMTRQLQARILISGETYRNLPAERQRNLDTIRIDEPVHLKNKSTRVSLLSIRVPDVESRPSGIG